MPDRLPALTLPEAAGGAAHDLRAARGPRVLVTLHDPRCAECVRYVERIAEVRNELGQWGADVLIISPEPPDAGSALSAIGTPIVVDRDAIIGHGRLGIIVADQWGEVYFASAGESLHDATEPAEVVDWARFVAIQCPECEGPEGGWRDL